MTLANQTLNLQQNQVPPCVPGLAILGNALALNRNPLAFFVQAYQQYGPVYRIRALQREILVLAGLEANQFMTRHGDEYLGSQELFGNFAAEMDTEIFLVAMDGSEHRHLRGEMRDGYSRDAFFRYLPEVGNLVKQTAREWSRTPNLPVTRAMQRLIGRQLGVALANFDTDPYFDDLTYFLNMIMNACVMKTIPRFMLKSPLYRRAKARVVEMAREIVRRHREEPIPGRAPDLIDDLLTATTEDGKPLPEGAIIAATIGPMIAGIDTAANTTSFMLYNLLKHPDILDRVQREVDAVMSRGNPASQDFRAMPALHAAALETMRMYPVAFAIPRTCIKPFQFKGYPVQVGREVFVASGVAHYLPEHYPEPYTFDIDRSAPPRNEHRKAGAFVPYGLGAHTCLGAGIAEVQIMYTVAVLLHHFSVKLDPPNYQLGVRYLPLPRPDQHFRVRVEPRR